MIMMSATLVVEQDPCGLIDPTPQVQKGATAGL